VSKDYTLGFLVQQFYCYLLATDDLSRKWSYSAVVQMVVYDTFVVL